MLQARLSVAGRSTPSQALLTRSRILLDLALQLYPDDPEVWRLRRELAQKLEDSKTALHALEQYVRLSPKDDVAQLQLVTERAEQQGQTVQKQIELVGKVLDSPAGKNMSPPLRSRLASFMADRAWNSGDMKTFKKRLAQALKWDSETNLQAAKLVLNLATTRQASPDALTRAMMMVVKADPLNSEHRRELAHLLITQGAYPVAAQQFNAAGRLQTKKLDAQTMRDWVISLAAVGATDTALNLFRQYEIYLVLRQRELERMKQEGDPRVRGEQDLPEASTQTQLPAAGGVTHAQETDVAAAEAEAADKNEQDPALAFKNKLPIDLEALRLAIHEQTRDQILADESYGWIQRNLHDRMKSGEVDKAQATEMLAWLSVLFNRKLDDTAAQIEKLGASSSASDPAWLRIRAMLDLRQGRKEDAKRYFQSQLGKDPLAAYGLALLLPEGSIKRGRMLQQVIDEAPDSLVGLLAAFALRNQGLQPKPSPTGAALVEALARWPGVLESPDFDEKRWVRLKVDVNKHEYQYLDPIRATVTIQNIAGVPLAVGPDGPIPTRLFLRFTPRQGGRALGAMPASVENLYRRLRLAPREKMTVQVNLTTTVLGQFVFGVPHQRFTFDARFILNPNFDQSTGRVVPLPSGGEVNIRSVQRLPVPAEPKSVTRWINALNEPNREELFKALAQLAQLAPLMTGVEDQTTVETGLKMIQAIEERYPTLDPVAQAWTIGFASRTTEGNPGMPQLLNAAKRSKNPLIRIVYLLAHVRDDPDSPDLNAAMRDDNPLIAEFAKAHRAAIVQRLAEQAANQQ